MFYEIGNCGGSPFYIFILSSFQCRAYIHEFIDILIKLIVRRFPPKDICQKLGFCSSTIMPDLNETRCSEGPSYWCSSLTTSRLCNSTFYCASVVWLPTHASLLPNILLPAGTPQDQEEAPDSHVAKPPLSSKTQEECSSRRLEDVCESIESALACNYVAQCYAFFMKGSADKLSALELKSLLRHTRTHAVITGFRNGNIALELDL
ncbi:unnamed protein product [Protopolystoma xenopodis]|uniref:Saposin B-type domain-containing protein n=1 Tax=Protopolystoma xenopodis TaxID=117903 RepID=A0A3S5A2H2_9PLAT|nr:unnamed protein product [Protopolystoma xenopodis]